MKLGEEHINYFASSVIPLILQQLQLMGRKVRKGKTRRWIPCQNKIPGKYFNWKTPRYLSQNVAFVEDNNKRHITVSAMKSTNSNDCQILFEGSRKEDSKCSGEISKRTSKEGALGTWKHQRCLILPVFVCLFVFLEWTAEDLNQIVQLPKRVFQNYGSKLSIKEVQIVYRLFLVNCYLLHVPRLPSQPASNLGGLVIHWTSLNWLELAWQYIAMTRNS